MERCPRCGKFTLENDIFNPAKGRCLHEDCGYTTYKCATSYIPDKEKKKVAINKDAVKNIKIRDGYIVSDKQLLKELLSDAIKCIETGTCDIEVIERLRKEMENNGRHYQKRN